MPRGDDIQAQNIPPNIQPNDPNAMEQVLQLSRQNLMRLNQVEKRLRDIEEIVLE